MAINIQKVKQSLIYFIIITLPIMTLVNLFGKIKVNFAISDIFVALLVLIITVDFIKKRLFITESRELRAGNLLLYWWYFLGFILLMLISNTRAYLSSDIQSGSLLTTVNEGIKFIVSACYFYIGYYSLKDKKDFIKVIRFWTLTALVVSIIGCIVTTFTILGQPIQTNLFIITNSNRLLGTLTDPNLAAAYLNVSFYITLLFLIYTDSKKETWIGYITLIIIAISIILTQSRSGIIAFIISLLIYSILNIKKIYRYVPIILLIIFIVYFGILDIDAIYFDKYISTTLDKRIEQIKEKSGEAEVRLNLAKAAFEMGKDYPIIGVGRGNYPFNSKDYYKKIGIDTESKLYESQYANKIPHNTYLTFFAEFGVLGLVLFLSIFFIILKLNLKLKLPINKVLLSLLIGYMAQSLAINLENFRGIWFVLGLYITTNEIITLQNSTEEKKKSISNKKLAVISMALLIIGIVIFLDAAGRYTKPIELGSEPLVAYFDDFKPNEEYIFRYYIEGYTDSKDKPSAYIKIFSIDNKNNEEILNKITYWKPKGYGNLLFTPSENTKRIKVEIIPTNFKGTKTEIRNGKIVNKNNGKGEILFADYKYLPDIFEDKFVQYSLINLEIIEDTSEYELFANKFIDEDKLISIPSYKDIKSIYYDGTQPINLSDKILFLGATKEELSDRKIKLEFKFKCIGKMDADYKMWLHGRVIDKNIVSEKRQKYGFENWDHFLKTKTSEWIVGKEYEHEYILEANSGQYYLSFGFWNSQYKDTEIFRLYPKINLGWIQIK